MATIDEEFISSVDELRTRMENLGVMQILVKELAPNDNSKNQPYVAKGDLAALNFLPVGALREERTDAGNVTVKGPLNLYWLQADGGLSHAPHTQIIFYPQYPEVRLSGFLKGSKGAPSKLMNSRMAGRKLFLGLTSDRKIIAYAATADSKLSNSLKTEEMSEELGVFRVLKITSGHALEPRQKLLAELTRIHSLDWIASKSLKSNGSIVACNSPQCVGYTLEAELGIARNGRTGPDIFGWEVKAGVVSALSKPFGSKQVTLITPEPNGGFYKSSGKSAFVRKYGYADKNGVPDRLYFGGVHKFGERHANTKLELTTNGYDAAKNRITNASGSIALIDLQGNVAAEWSFAHLMTIWSAKHAFAAYVPALAKTVPERMYRYGNQFLLGEGTDFLLFLNALAAGNIVYDPGIKLENASSDTPRLKPRSQFRMKSSQLGALYAKSEIVSV